MANMHVDSLSRRGFVRLAGLAAGGSVLSGTADIASAREDRWVRDPRWAGFLSVLDTDDGYLLTGIRTNVEDEQVGWAVKLDSRLRVEWNRTYQSPPHLRELDHGEDHDGLSFALPDGEGGYLLVGWWHTESSDSRYAWLTRVSSRGIPRWSRIFQRDGVNSFRDDFAAGVRVKGGYVLAGRTIASEYLDRENGDGWLVFLRDDGRIRWARAYDPSGTSNGWTSDHSHASFSGIVRTGDGFLVVGEATPRGRRDPETRGWVVHVDSNGRERWSRTYDTGDAGFTDVARDGNGFVVSGATGRKRLMRELHDYRRDGGSLAYGLDSSGRVRWRDTQSGEGFHAVVARDRGGGVFVGSRNRRPWAVSYDRDGDRRGSSLSNLDGTYADVARTKDGYLLVGYGRRGGTTDALVTTLDRRELEDDRRDDDRDDDHDGRDDRDDHDDGRTHLLEIIARENGDVYYEFRVRGTVEKAHVSDRVKAESNDHIERRGDTVVVSGFTGNTGWGDAFRYTGRVTSFTHLRGDAEFEIRRDGERVSVRELVS
jgi:hypothetical protein